MTLPASAHALIPIMRANREAEPAKLAHLADLSMDECYEGLVALESRGAAGFWIPYKDGVYLTAQWSLLSDRLVNLALENQ